MLLILDFTQLNSVNNMISAEFINRDQLSMQLFDIQ